MRQSSNETLSLLKFKKENFLVASGLNHGHTRHWPQIQYGFIDYWKLIRTKPFLPWAIRLTWSWVINKLLKWSITGKKPRNSSYVQKANIVQALVSATMSRSSKFFKHFKDNLVLCLSEYECFTFVCNAIMPFYPVKLYFIKHIWCTVPRLARTWLKY